MKKLLFTLVFVFIGIFTAEAQVWLGGSVNATINKDFKTFAVAPDVGYSIPNTSFSIACAIEYGGTIQKGEDYIHSLTVSPYFRYDIYTLEERFSLFVDLASDIDALESNFFDIGLSPGVSFDITEHWSAEFSYGFLGYEWERNPGDKTDHRFVLDFAAAAASFGISYFF